MRSDLLSHIQHCSVDVSQCDYAVNNMLSLLCQQYGTTSSMVVSLSQSLAQNLGIQWDPASKRSKHETLFLNTQLL